jgi:hypothetical protein
LLLLILLIEASEAATIAAEFAVAENVRGVMVVVDLQTMKHMLHSESAMT